MRRLTDSRQIERVPDATLYEEAANAKRLIRELLPDRSLRYLVVLAQRVAVLLEEERLGRELRRRRRAPRGSIARGGLMVASK